MIAARLGVIVTIAVMSVAGQTASAAAQTSVTCASDPTVQSARVWSVAAQELADLATPRMSIPFGTTRGGTYLRTSAYAWTSGFYPTSLWRMYEQTGDPVWLKRARSFTDRVLPVASWTGSHDLGFMVGLPAELGLRLDPSTARKDRYRQALVTAARSLSSRWNEHVGAIKSADYNGSWGLIIDSAMNAPLLLRAGAMLDGTEGARLRTRGLRHMLTLAATFVRPDGSTVHRQVFNPRTGALIGPVYGQGLSSRSTWARGQAWAINGFAQAYAATSDARMLDVARRTADRWLASVPAGCVAAWDLDVTSDRAPRDSSAAAIAADGLLNLGRIEPDPERAALYTAAGWSTLATLTGTKWVLEGAQGLLQRQAYNIPAAAREGSYVWGDAYLLSGLAGIGH